MSVGTPADWAFAHAARAPGAPAVASPAARLDYAALAGRARALADRLFAAGLRPGGRILVALGNTPATVVVGLAVHALGAAAVEVNREWSPEVLDAILGQAEVRQAVIWGRDARAWGPLAAARRLERLWVVHPDLPPPALLAALAPTPASAILEDGRGDPREPAPPPAPRPEVRPEQPALVLYTSGSTGTPRGVVQTFRNLEANTRSIVEYLGLGPSDRALLVLPLYYCYGRSVLQTHLFVGGSIWLDTRFAFPRLVLEAGAAEGCTGFAGVPLTFELIRRQVDVSTLDRGPLRYLTQAGGAMAQDTIDWVRRAFAPARLFVMYGQTEATARLSYLPPERAVEKRGSIGVAIPGVELRVVDDQGAALPPGQTGHLVARGDNVTLGYLGDPAATAEILRDGWLWTGDLAVRDADGFFFHRGRSKEILKIGGHRVSPVEIEHVVAGHPDVAEAAVVGAADALQGERPLAFVVARAGRSPEPEEIRRFCRERLPAYCVPAEVRLVEALPRNESGKLLRAELARRLTPA